MRLIHVTAISSYESDQSILNMLKLHMRSVRQCCVMHVTSTRTMYIDLSSHENGQSTLNMLQLPKGSVKQ